MLAVVYAAHVAFQCPDGSPPPCRGAATTTIPGRVPAIALSDNTWLVLPFENTARASDAEVIRQASVSQLTAELSRWNGVRVITDDRVADLLQQLPAAQRDRPGLDGATSLARRVGAGRIILGSYLALGGRANVTAKAYETRSGREIRTARDVIAGLTGASALDSLSAAFNRLARTVLDVPAGEGPANAGVGTSSMEAYRAYVAGMDAANRVDIGTAQENFARAISLDSTFALASFAAWRFSPDTVTGRRFQALTMRHLDRLPPRARAIAQAYAASRGGDHDGLCRGAAQVLGIDSSDAEGWVLLSQCDNDTVVVIDNGVPRRRGNLTRAIRSAERAYALAPGSVVAISAVLNALQAGPGMYCTAAVTGLCPPDKLYRVSFVPSADSVVTVIRPWSEVRNAPPDLEPAAFENYIQRMRRALQLCEQYALISDTRIVHNAVGSFALAAGDLDAAAAHLGHGTTGVVDTSFGSRAGYLILRFQLALAQERPAEFQAYADSLIGLHALAAPYRSMLGHLGEGGDTTPSQRQNSAWRQLVVAGTSPAGLDTLLQQISARLAPPAREDMLQLTTLAGFHALHTGPALDTASSHPLKRAQAWLARADTAHARASLAEFDRSLLARHPNTPDDGGWLFSAELHTDLRDTTVALQRMQEFARRWAAQVQNNPSIMGTHYFQSTTPRLWGRAWLLYGDLAMARGQNADARRAYRMVVGLWEQGDPIVQPAVTRARTALAQLGG